MLFSGSNVPNLARGTLSCIASRNFSCVLRIFFVAIFRRWIPRLVQRHKITMRTGRCLVYVDHCGNDTSPYISFVAPRKPLAPRFAISSFLGDIAPSCTVAPLHLDCAFRIALAPCIQPQTVIRPLAIRSVIFRFQKDIVFRSVGSDIFVLRMSLTGFAFICAL